ncbi:MAG: type II secretion system F family protein [Hydrogenophaga sp.]|nr:type II secretion system F family protein [Hydrogenophaga sp.]NIM40990.1 type II secretion system F family protein [Hydrogenophaga sp.]NIN26348.1 type II secretion system F family protein [Hydrogenophaga sp.]NIN31223.1 type II secretion system F family protein [Hydrogenophaga sp.]NIN55262.1 type II secretion system F family protein [Hydrogenophaga sp.]NIO53646.1 type II secretion system F family protein [Hydrogenophaga sp.]
MRFRIKSFQPDLRLVTQTVDALDEAEARRLMVERGHEVVSVRSDGGALGGARRSAAFPLVLFSQELLALLRSGVGIVEAVQTLVEKESKAATREVLERIRAALRQGLTFSAALQAQPHAFTPLYVATVRASERTSSLAEALERYVDYARRVDEIKGKLINAAIYPVMLVLVSLLVIGFLMVYVVPRFANVYQDMGDKLPWASRWMLHWGQAVEQNGMALVVALGGVVLLAASPMGRGAWALLLQKLWTLPAIGDRLRVFQLARLYRTVGMLLRGGIAVVPALEMVQGLLSSGLRENLAAAGAQVREGLPLSGALAAHGLTTPVSLRMLSVGERTGNMGEMMERAAAFHDEELARSAEWATRVVGPALMLVMGVLIGAIVVLMYLPIFQLAESIQ